MIKPAFDMACEEDAVRRNPFQFKLTDVVVNDSERRISLTPEQERVWMEFIRTDQTYSKYYVEKTKTESGCRYLPMTDEIFESLQNMLKNRPKPEKEMIVDGYGGFLMLDKNGRPKVALHIENEMRWAMKKYRKLHPEYLLPHITPHVFRHTFCTKMANAGMDIKSLQYLMGHSDAGITMNVYTHASYDHAAEEMKKIIDFHLGEGAELLAKSG